jgi:H+/Cl- antiporter ClcA
MGISRGFLKLSIIAGLIGFLVISFHFAIDPYPHWNGSPLIIGDYVAEPEWLSQRFGFTILFIGVPVFLTLLVGWIVARFRRDSD